MYLVTNRQVHKKKKGFDAFGKKLNPKGPHELRLVEVTKTATGYDVEVLDDTLNREEKLEIGLPTSKIAYRSVYVAKSIFDNIRRNKRNLLLFVHGFNNNVEAVVERAFLLQEEFGVEVLPFSWPADGGGAGGVLSYKSDKKDARASIGALDRVLDKVRQYLFELREEELEGIRADAHGRFPRDAESMGEFLTRAIEEDCSYRVSILLHSMGNYLYKQLLKSSIYSANELLFDNVVMVAADTNNRNHKEWIDRAAFRNRLYVTINESDSALRLSAMKGGDEQLPRLGRFPFQLNSSRAVYANMSDAEHIGDSHAYFEGVPLKNISIKDFFKRALNGETAEGDLEYDASRNYYRVPK